MNYKNTMVELVQELDKLSESEAKNKMVEMAKKGEFHDFRSKAACGKMYFIQCAQWCYRNLVLPSDIEIIKRLEQEIKDGEYDEECTREDKIILAKELNDPKNSMSQKDKDFFAHGMGISKSKTPFGVNYYVR